MNDIGTNESCFLSENVSSPPPPTSLPSPHTQRSQNGEHFVGQKEEKHQTSRWVSPHPFLSPFLLPLLTAHPTINCGWTNTPTLFSLLSLSSYPSTFYPLSSFFTYPPSLPPPLPPSSPSLLPFLLLFLPPPPSLLLSLPPYSPSFPLSLPPPLPPSLLKTLVWATRRDQVVSYRRTVAVQSTQHPNFSFLERSTVQK